MSAEYFVFANNAFSTLSAPLTTSATTLYVAAGSGALFPSLGANQYFVATLQDAATGLVQEIIWVTAVSGDTLTIVRAQEGTVAQSWLAGDDIANLVTAGSLNGFLQDGQQQAQAENYAADVGTPNAYVCNLSPALTAHTVGLPIRMKIGTGNTSTMASTLNPGPGVKTIAHPNGSAIQANDMIAGGIYTFIYDGTNYQLSQPQQPQSQSQNYAIDTGAANAYICTLTPPLTSHIEGMPIRVVVANTNTGASTLNPGPGAISIVHPDSSPLAAGELLASATYEFIYTGTYYEIVSQVWPVQNSGLAQVATGTIKGRTTAGTGPVQDLTAAQATALINAFGGDAGSGGTKGLVPAPGAGTAAAGQALLAGGAFGLINLALQTLAVTTNSNGSYVKLGSLIIQWGYQATTGSNFTFPTAFTNVGTPPNQSVAFIAGNENVQGSNVDNAYGYPVNNTTYFIATKSSSTGGSTNYPCYWLAIGS